MAQLRVLFLGGAYSQIPIIKEAKKRGYYIVTCDYLPENPGHKFADEYYNISTIDYEAILSLASKIKPNLIIAYASDPAAPVAAYVSEKLGLPGNSYDSVQILSEKDLFRQFMKENGFNVPQSVTINSNDNIKEKLKILPYPYIIKPTDSSGSKGVSLVSNNHQIESAASFAFSFSKNKRIIAEEFIDNTIADIHGDGFVIDGELVFSCLGDHLYNKKSNPFNPIATLCPSSQPNEIIKIIEDDVARLIKGCRYKNGPINIEARINSSGIHFIMEIGPRNGGHFVPQAIKYSSNFYMVKALLYIFSKIEVIPPKSRIGFSAYYAIHSDFEGLLEKIQIKEKLKPFIKEFHQYIMSGQMVLPFSGAHTTIGIIILEFGNREEMEYIISNMHDYIELKIKKAS